MATRKILNTDIVDTLSTPTRTHESGNHSNSLFGFLLGGIILRTSLFGPRIWIPLRWDHSEDYISRVRYMPLLLLRCFREIDPLFKTVSA
jgi:hypothetical protein